jgi:hypothetical protein
MFAFLAGVRNFSRITPISLPRGLPADVSEYVLDAYDSYDDGYDCHSASWLTLKELRDYDYTVKVNDARDNGREVTLREFIGDWLFDEVTRLQEHIPDSPENIRLVFWFDN